MTWEVNAICKLAVYFILEKKKNFRALLCFKRIRNNLHWKMIFLKQVIYTRYVIAKLSKFVQIKFAH